MYRPPSGDIELFFNNFFSCVETLTNKTKTFVCGDFNIDLLKNQNNQNVRDFVDNMFTLGLFPVINILFADDTNLMCCNKSINELVTITNQE